MNRSQSSFEANSKLVLRNDAAIFPWVIATFFCFGVLVMTVLILRDGLPTDLGKTFSAGMVLFFWTGAVGIAFWAVRLRRIRVEVDRNGARLIKINLFLQQEVIGFTAQTVERLEVVESKDSDGDPYFYCELAIAHTAPVHIVEGHDHKRVERAARRLREAIGL